MNRRAAILVAVIAAVVALIAIPAIADERDDAGRPERLSPPAWVDQTVAELRDRVAERAAAAVVERHDPIHIARAWMTKAHATLFAL